MRQKSRKQRKALWIRVKNAFRDSECSDGTFWCNHVYEPERPWVWVDFRFLSQRHHRRYFATAAQTLEYSVLTSIEDEAWEIVDRELPLEDYRTVFTKEKPDGEFFEIRFEEPFLTQHRHRQKRFSEIFPTLLDTRTIAPKIEVRRDYGDVAIGLWVTLNMPSIDATSIHSFIQQFRDLGEPIQHGVVWSGDEIAVDAREAYDRYRRISAA